MFKMLKLLKLITAISLVSLATPAISHASNLKQFFGGGSTAKTYYKKIFTSSGTWTHPNPGTAITVQITAIGGGGTGFCQDEQTSTYPGTMAGAASSFGSLTTAAGGTAGGYNSPGIGSSPGACETRANPANYNYVYAGGSGGPGALGFGAGGSTVYRGYTGSGYTLRACGGGAGYVAVGSHMVTTNQTISVGAGGSCAGLNDADGRAGAVIVEWWQ